MISRFQFLALKLGSKSTLRASSLRKCGLSRSNTKTYPPSTFEQAWRFYAGVLKRRTVLLAISLNLFPDIDGRNVLYFY